MEKEIISFFNCSDSRASTVYLHNALNYLSNLKITNELKYDKTYDIQLFVEYPECYKEVEPFFKKRAAKHKVYYNIDPHLTLDFTLDLIKKTELDFVFTTQLSSVDKIEEVIGKGKAIWIPNAAHQMHVNANILRPGPIRRVYDLSFVGTLFDTKWQEERKKLLIKLYEEFNVNPIHLAIPEEIGLVYKTSKVGWNKSIRGDLNMRTFEIMASGTYLLTDKQDGMDSLFKNKDIFTTYDNEEDMIYKTKHILENYSEFEKKALEAQDLILKEHLYTHRAKDMLRHLI